jgi:hypothetical protein
MTIGLDPELELYLQERVDPLVDRMVAHLRARTVRTGNLGVGGRGEQLMRCLLHSRGWMVMRAPYHLTQSPGPDAVVWKRKGGRLHLAIVDNKAGRRPGLVSRASGLTAPSLTTNLPTFIYALRRATGPRHAGVSQLLERVQIAARAAASRAERQGLRAAQGRIELPPGVQLWVTNANGAATGISSVLGPGPIRGPGGVSLPGLGIRFVNLHTRQVPEACRQHLEPPRPSSGGTSRTSI